MPFPPLHELNWPSYCSSKWRNDERDDEDAGCVAAALDEVWGSYAGLVLEAVVFRCTFLLLYKTMLADAFLFLYFLISVDGSNNQSHQITIPRMLWPHRQ